VSQLSLFSAEARPTAFADLGGLFCGPGRVVRFGGGDTARISVDAASAGHATALRAATAPFGLALEPGERHCAGRELRTPYRRDLSRLAHAWTDARRVKTIPAGFQLDGASLRLWVLAAGRADRRGGYLLVLDAAAPATHGPLIAALTRLGLPPARVSLPRCPDCQAEEDADCPADEGGQDPADVGPQPATPGDPGDPDDPVDPAPPDELPVVDLTVDLTVDHTVDLPAARPERPHVACRGHHLVVARECRAAGPALRITGARRMRRLVELVGPRPAELDTTGWPQYWGRSQA
jgi:hypothetical protein